jgi:toxin secretion/phage lysis holin
MKSTWNTVQIIIAAAGGWFGWFMGGVDGFLYALIVFVVLDYVTGVMCAILEKKLSSVIGARGIFKKVLVFGLVGVGHMIDSYLIQSGNAIRTAVLFFYISNEGISVLENATRIGLPVPAKLKNILAQLHNKGDNDNESA